MKTTKTIHTLLVMTAFLMSACGGQGGGENGLSGKVQIDGSSTVYPLTEAVAEEFRTVEPDIRVTVGSSGTGAGFKKFCRGEIDITNASRSIKESEKSACQSGNINPEEITVALDGIAIVVNPDNDWLKEITVEQLREIWQPNSKVQKWSDLNPGWPEEKIRLFGPTTAHGTYDFFTGEIMGESGASRSDYNAVADYNVAVQGINTDRYALGYFGLAYFAENANKLKLIGVDGGNGVVKPSIETVKSGDYALSRPLFIYVSEQSASNEAIKAFVTFYLENAGPLAKAVGYIPLPDEQHDAQMEKFREISGQGDQPEEAVSQ